MTCLYCLLGDDVDHTACAFISDLAAMRGISFEKAKAQYDEDNLVDATEAQMQGEDAELPAPAMPMFETAETQRAFQHERDNEEIAPARLDRLGFRGWLRR